MGRKKKHYHYDLDQYRDANNNLLFLLYSLPLDSNGLVHIFTDCYDNKVAYTSLESLTQISLTYKEAIKRINQFHQYPITKLPQSYHVSIRHTAIHTMIELCYTDILEDHQPSRESLAYIFGTDRSSLLDAEKRLQNKLKTDTSLAQECESLTNFCSQRNIMIAACVIF